MRTEIAETSVPFVLGIVGVRTKPVLCRFGCLDISILIYSYIRHVLVAKGRRENAQVDYRLEIAGSVLSANVCTQEGIVERVVGIVIVNGLDGLRLHVSGELEGGFFCLGGFLGKDV